MMTSVTSKHYTLVFASIGSVIFIGRDSLLLYQDGGPSTSLRNPFKIPVFYLKFDSPILRLHKTVHVLRSASGTVL